MRVCVCESWVCVCVCCVCGGVMGVGLGGVGCARSRYLRDDPVRHTNSRGTVSLATSGANKRTTQLFINTKVTKVTALDDALCLSYTDRRSTSSSYLACKVHGYGRENFLAALHTPLLITTGQQLP